ncbi:YncE family protein [Methylocapsa sp. D3K7]|uniref:YncE family protein n=1 Tax=Methylocapsa sp. D3K7 TaxID=3041435 RepID=UPI00244EAE97|nr:YncE family protein [Methylocapsa sp. D3K7]WGJ15083.1 YncE family protein [Methylocapsa sp. D3K7]
MSVHLPALIMGLGAAMTAAAAPIEPKAYVSNGGPGTVSGIMFFPPSPPSVVSTTGVGRFPQGVAVSPDGTRIYVPNMGATSGSGTLSVINAAVTPPSVTATVRVGKGPTGVAVSPDGKRVYVANQSSDTVSVIDTTTTPPSVAATVAFGTNTFPFQLVFSPDGTRVYVANAGGGVWVVDATANPPSLLTFITVGAGPSGIAITPDGAVVYVVNNGDSSVSLISTISNTVVATIPVGTNPSSVGIIPPPSNTAANTD